MKKINQQQGITLLSFSFLVIVLVFVGLLMMRILPSYVQHYTVMSTMDRMVERSESSKNPFAGATKESIKNNLLNQLDINGIYNVKAEHITLTPQKTGFAMRVNYETRIKLVANINVHINFDNTVVISTRDT